MGSLSEMLSAAISKAVRFPALGRRKDGGAGVSLVSPPSVAAAFLAATVLLYAAAAAAEGTRLLHEVAEPRKIPPGAPPPSAVCFSTRWERPRDGDDPHDSFRTAAAFHATHFVWVYSLHEEFVAAVKDGGYGFQGAINSVSPDWPEMTRRRGRILDLDGRPVAAPWMRGWEGYWGCVNSPDWRTSYLAYAKRSIDVGAESLQMDDPPCNFAAVAWGGCFCRHCMAGFPAHLAAATTPAERAEMGLEDLDAFDYGEYLRAAGAPVGDAFARWNDPLKPHFIEFQRQSVADFYAWVRPEIDRHAGRRVPMSSNNYDGRWSFPYDLFDFGMAELPPRSATPAALYERFAAAHDRGKTQVFTFVSDDPALTRRVIATSYACGGHTIVPWDVYMGSDVPRYFGRPEDYADLYRFVRDHADLIDGYEDAAFALPGTADPRHGERPPAAIRRAEEVSAFVRAAPGQAAADVVVHLVDWSDRPQGFRLELDGEPFFAAGRLALTLLRPGHPPEPLEAAESDSPTILVDLPPLEPWGIVRVSVDKDGVSPSATPH